MDKTSKDKDKTIRFLDSITPATYQIMEKYLNDNKATYVGASKAKFVLYEDIVIIKVYRKYYRQHGHLNADIKKLIWGQLHQITKKAADSFKDRMNKTLSLSNNEEIVQNVKNNKKFYHCKAKQQGQNPSKIKSQLIGMHQKNKQQIVQHIKNKYTDKFKNDQLNFFEDEQSDNKKQDKKTPVKQGILEQKESKRIQDRQQLNSVNDYKSGKLPKIYILYNSEDKTSIIYNIAHQNKSQSNTNINPPSEQNVNNPHQDHYINSANKDKKEQMDIQRTTDKKGMQEQNMMDQINNLKITIKSLLQNSELTRLKPQVQPIFLQSRVIFKKIQQLVMEKPQIRQRQAFQRFSEIKKQFDKFPFHLFGIVSPQKNQKQPVNTNSGWLKEEDETIKNFSMDPQAYYLQIKCMAKYKNLESIKQRLIDLEIETTQVLDYAFMELQKIIMA